MSRAGKPWKGAANARLYFFFVGRWLCRVGDTSGHLSFSLPFVLFFFFFPLLSSTFIFLLFAADRQFIYLSPDFFLLEVVVLPNEL